VQGSRSNRRSDIFGARICLYELTTLRRAFKGTDDFETMKRIVAGDVILPSSRCRAIRASSRRSC